MVTTQQIVCCIGPAFHPPNRSAAPTETIIRQRFPYCRGNFRSIYRALLTPTETDSALNYTVSLFSADLLEDGPADSWIILLWRPKAPLFLLFLLLLSSSLTATIKWANCFLSVSKTKQTKPDLLRYCSSRRPASRPTRNRTAIGAQIEHTIKSVTTSNQSVCTEDDAAADVPLCNTERIVSHVVDATIMTGIMKNHQAQQQNNKNRE